MNIHNGAEAPETPTERSRHASQSSDESTVCGSIYEKDIESQQIKPVERTFSQRFGMSSPISANLDDIDEEDLADSNDEKTPDANAALDYQRSALQKCIPGPRDGDTDTPTQLTTIQTATPDLQPS
jgi:hypothetical protein